ncbi:hypothetical protein BDW66DRAFT_148716 [Aspergillus desertorum]
MVATRWRDIVAWWVVEQCVTTKEETSNERPRTQRYRHGALKRVVAYLTDEERRELRRFGRRGGGGGGEDDIKREGKGEDANMRPKEKVKLGNLNGTGDVDEVLTDLDVIPSRNREGSEAKLQIESESDSASGSLNGDKEREWQPQRSRRPKRYVSLKKIAAGSASSGRKLENVDWVVSAGEYVAWPEGPMICVQHLGFHPNGSLYPINRFNTRGWLTTPPTSGSAREATY